jgi:hypothetical protein
LREVLVLTIYIYIERGRGRENNEERKREEGREHHQAKTANGFENANIKRVWRRTRQTSKLPRKRILITTS